MCLLPGTFVLLLIVWRGTASISQPHDCVLPGHWLGTWFQASVPQPIYITETAVSTKGSCIESQGRKYLLHNTDMGCYQCLVFYEKHHNIIHYKESYCSPGSRPPELRQLCGHVTGDLPLFAMMRVDYRPVECPLRGPFTFSYTRGHMAPRGECGRPQSRLDQCLRPSRMVFTYRNCPDVAGSKQSVEEVECVAMWKEGSARYLVTRRVGITLNYPEEAFRCSIYERAKPQEQSWLDFRLAEAGEASCSGLFSITDGIRRLQLVSAAPYVRCQFPPWTSSHRRWHALDGNTGYHLNDKNTSIAVQDRLQPASMDCTEIVDVTSTRATLVVRTTAGCRGGFQCLRLFRRDEHVLEMQLGELSYSVDHACDRSAPTALAAAQQFHTLVSADLQGVSCPHIGEFRVQGVKRDPRVTGDLGGRAIRDLTAPISDLHMGCRAPDTFVLISSIGVQSKAFRCRGGWWENDTYYLVASPRGIAQLPRPVQLCFVTRPSSTGHVLQVSTMTGSCHRGVRPGHDGLLALNATPTGACRFSAGSRFSLQFSVCVYTAFVLAYILL